MSILFIIASAIILGITSKKLKTDILDMELGTVRGLYAANVIGGILTLLGVLNMSFSAFMHLDMALSPPIGYEGVAGMPPQRIGFDISDGANIASVILAAICIGLAITMLILAVKHIRNCKKLKALQAKIASTAIQYCTKCGAALLPGSCHCTKCGAAANNNESKEVNVK